MLLQLENRGCGKGLRHRGNMKTHGGRVGDLQLVIGHSVGLADQNLAPLCHQHCAGEVAGLNKWGDVGAETAGDSTVGASRRGPETRNCCQQQEVDD